MKYKLVIKNANQEIVYQGKPLDLPIKIEAIKQKSIELFDDDEPCIIHQSYAVQKLINEFVQSVHQRKVKDILISTINYDTSFIDLKDIENCYLSLEV